MIFNLKQQHIELYNENKHVMVGSLANNYLGTRMDAVRMAVLEAL